MGSSFDGTFNAWMMHAVRHAGCAALLGAGLLGPVVAAPSKIVAFGDSLSDTGNAQAKFAAVGIALPAQPYADGRFTNGPVAVEVMASQLGVALDSHAYGGALTGVDNRITTGGILAGTGVKSQITQYIGQSGGTVDTSALYVVWAGGNDFFSAANPATVASAVNNLVQDVTLLYQSGARDFFIPNLPDLSTTAEAIKAGGVIQAGAQQLTLGFNQMLAQAMAGLQGQLAGAHIQVFDTFAVLASVRAGYAQRGANVTQSCWSGDFLGQGTLCADPSQYYLWDNVHPTAGVHQAVGLAFAQAVPEPATWALSLMGLAMVAGALHRQRRAG